MATRIVIAGQFPPPIGGQNLMIQELFRELEGVPGYRVEHLRFNFSPSFQHLRRFTLHKVIEIGRVWLRMVRLRRQGPIDILWFPAGGPQTIPIIRDIVLLPLLSMLARRTVVQFHAAGIADRSQTTDPLVSALAAISRRCVDAAIVMTDFNRRDPLRLGISRVEVSPHRIADANPESHFPPNPSERLDFLYVGHLCENKGTPQLIRAFARLLRSWPHARLTLVGACLEPFTPADGQYLLDELDVSHAVTLAGEHHGVELHAFFRAADALVFPSVAPYESFGLVLIEAMMWGLPIVATDWRGNRDVLGNAFGGVLISPSTNLEDEIEVGLSHAIANRAIWPEWSQQNRRRFLDSFETQPSDRFGSLIASLTTTARDGQAHVS